MIERELAAGGPSARRSRRRTGTSRPTTWRQVDPPPDAAELARERRRERASGGAAARDARIETRTVAVTSGRMVRNWFETTVADEATELGVELSIVEHPHLLARRSPSR